MIKSGIGWLESLIIIGAANLIITIPMILNGHAGVKYGIPFPVVGRSSFGIKGIHIPSITRGIVACGWFGIQTWIGGLALYEIICVLGYDPGESGLNLVQFICFGVFWFINMYFIWKGTDSIKWLEEFSAPILILMGLVLIGWGAYQAGGFGVVLEQSTQLQKPSTTLVSDNDSLNLTINPLLDKEGNRKANYFQIRTISEEDTTLSFWGQIPPDGLVTYRDDPLFTETEISLRIGVDKTKGAYTSSWVNLEINEETEKVTSTGLWDYIKWLTIMLGFWATMSLSIADITRYAPTQKSQRAGQFIGLPGTMMLYSFVAIFVTCAAVINFPDVLIADDAPWDPTALLGKFETPWVVIIAQVFMIIATLSTNIAANVIAPSNAFSNLMPSKISFKKGGTITGIIGILICPWWIMDSISGLMIFISGLLGPVLAIMLCDYFVIRKTKLNLPALYKEKGEYAYGKSGFNSSALIALIIGVFLSLVWSLIPALAFLSSLAWFSGFFISFIAYYLLMKNSKHSQIIKKNLA